MTIEHIYIGILSSFFKGGWKGVNINKHLQKWIYIPCLLWSMATSQRGQLPQKVWWKKEFYFLFSYQIY